MHRTLIKRYNAMVPKKGVGFFAGDMGNRTQDIASVIKHLNGTKVLILGNHDKGMNTMYNCGFDVVLWSAHFYIARQKVTMSHCPLPGIVREDTTGMRGSENEEWHGASRKKHQTCIVPNEGQFHLHGHIHSRKDKPVSKKILGRQMDVGVTAWGYRPVSYGEIQSWIMKTLKEEGNG